jgi:hypothetical protein
MENIAELRPVIQDSLFSIPSATHAAAAPSI